MFFQEKKDYHHCKTKVCTDKMFFNKRKIKILKHFVAFVKALKYDAKNFIESTPSKIYKDPPKRLFVLSRL